MLYKKPTIHDLQYVADSVAVIQWKGIGRRLGVGEVVLDEAEQNYPLTMQATLSNRFMHVLKAWHDGRGIIDGTPVPVTYSSLCDALEESGCREISAELKRLC